MLLYQFQSIFKRCKTKNKLIDLTLKYLQKQPYIDNHKNMMFSRSFEIRRECFHNNCKMFRMEEHIEFSILEFRILEFIYEFTEIFGFLTST